MAQGTDADLKTASPQSLLHSSASFKELCNLHCYGKMLHPEQVSEMNKQIQVAGQNREKENKDCSPAGMHGH